MKNLLTLTVSILLVSGALYSCKEYKNTKKDTSINEEFLLQNQYPQIRK